MRPRPVGLIILGLILIVTSIDSLYHIHIGGYDLYVRVNHEWPEWIIRIRFIGSYVFRLIGVVTGIGVLCLNGHLRKFLIGFSVYVLFTLPLHHTYSAQLFFSEPIYRARGSMFSLETFTWIDIILRWLIDGLFSLMVISYFSRPKVIAFFKKGAVAKPLVTE